MKRANVDLTKHNSFSGFIQRHSQDINNIFGHAPRYQEYDPNKLVSFIKNGVEAEHVAISDDKEDQILNKIQQIGKQPVQAMSFVYNTLLKGAALGLHEELEDNENPL